MASTCRRPSDAIAARYRAVVTDCLFCGIAAGTAPAHVVASDQLTVAFLDFRPLFKGHVLVIPRAHYETLADLPGNLVAPLFGAVQRLSAAMPAGLGAQGSFVGLNNTVSQSVPHLHVHVIPRRRKDGLKGFFWPRQSYRDEQHMTEVRDLLRAVLALK